MSEDIPVTPCPITGVTILEDRAIVERQAAIVLKRGVQSLRIEGVAPALLEKTLVVDLGAGRVLDARVRRFRVHRSEDAEPRIRELEEAVRRQKATSQGANQTLDRARDELRLWEEASTRTAVETGEDVAWGRDSSAEWEASFGEIAKRLTTLHEEIAHGVQTANDAVEKLEDLRGQLRNARRKTSKESAWLDLRLSAEEDGEVQVRITYAVPGACWRPLHRARWQGSVVHFETHATIWQRSGEDWNDVDLKVSTERASLGVDPPVLTTDELRVKKKAPGTQVAMREEEVESAGSPRLASEMPGIDDGGDALLLSAPSKASVSCDGRAHRILLSTFTADVESKLFVMSELEHTVLQKTSIPNESKSPILAGPVDLIRESGPVGRTRTLFVAPGERFDIGWGPEHELRVTREVEHLDPKRSKLSGWTHKAQRIQIKISNIGSGTHHFDVIERVPVSEVESVEVKVDAEATSAGKSPDADGFIRWPETLRAGERTTFKLGYTVSTKRDVSGI